VKGLEVIADNLSKAGWSWGCVSAIDSNGRTIWIVDAHRDDAKRFVVRADEKPFWNWKRYSGRVKVTRALPLRCGTAAAIRKIVLTLSIGGWQASGRVKRIDLSNRAST
jgi:hypothetical protein